MSISDELGAGIDEREPDRQRRENLPFMIDCVHKAMLLYKFDHPCGSCVQQRIKLPDYEPILDENDPIELAIKKIFQETEPNTAKAAIGEIVQMKEQDATDIQIKQVIKESFDKNANSILINVFENITLEQLKDVQAITEARWQNIMIIAEEVKQHIVECRELVKQDTGKQPNLSDCLCQLVLRLRFKLELNNKPIGFIIGKSEQNTRQIFTRCYKQMRAYFKNCHDFIKY
ncbi:hypothetical protein QUF74_00545 [Candidatus Halobeggiatoa sp. HSG11]|nr:hypothetical protein [Candidatus Halobeggiatoa sp. HSG11]